MIVGKFVKLFTTVRNHWKKTAFASGALAYGVNYGFDQYEIETVMKEFCEDAVKYGQIPAGNENDMKHITVILNPAANGRKAKKNFEKYCAPLLHLSGAYVTILETAAEGHAKKLVEEIDPKCNAIVVAGGDGCFSEVVTGLMRTGGEVCRVPVGVLPLGKRSTVAKRLLPASTLSEPASVASVRLLATATMAVVSGLTTTINTYRVEPLTESAEGGEGGKAVYGAGAVEWGCWVGVKRRTDALWWSGAARPVLPLVFPPKEALAPPLQASLRYTRPCSGCSACVTQRPDLLPTQPARPTRWWTPFASRQQPINNQPDYSKIENPLCGQVLEESIQASDIQLTTESVVCSNDSPPKLVLSLGPEKRYQCDVLYDGLKYIKGKEPTIVHRIESKQIEIRPDITDNQQEDKPSSLLIDNEDFDLRPIRVSLMPNSLPVFCPLNSQLRDISSLNHN